MVLLAEGLPEAAGWSYYDKKFDGFFGFFTHTPMIMLYGGGDGQRGDVRLPTFTKILVILPFFEKSG